MLDVHPSAHTPHGWRDLFIHIATIVVGLIIAVGLEQTVEFIHHRHQRSELEEALHVDTEKAVQDAENYHRLTVAQLEWLDTRIGQVQDALDSKVPPADFAVLKYQGTPPDAPDDPAWKAARSSGLIEVLPQNEIKLYTEIDESVNDIWQAVPLVHAASERSHEFRRKFERNGAKVADLSHSSRQDLEEYLNVLVAQQGSQMVFDRACGAVHSAELAVLKGDRDLNSIQRAATTGW